MKFQNLNNYRDIVVKPVVEENPKDIYLAIEYNDHGDDFLFIETKNGERFLYGWFLNRCGFPNYNELDESWTDGRFVRKPKLYKKDDHYETSNHLLWGLHNYICDRMTHRSLKSRDPQHNFNMALFYANEAYESGCMYHLERYRYDLLKYLEDNDIATDENILKAKTAKLDSRIDGVDGESGKIKHDGFIVCDRLHYVCVNGKCIKLSKVKKEYGDDDEWGFASMYVDVDQFRKLNDT